MIYEAYEGGTFCESRSDRLYKELVTFLFAASDIVVGLVRGLALLNPHVPLLEKANPRTTTSRLSVNRSRCIE
jgi:hypothetical protein